jgi:aryl-alcohol dehydrogenase-like predicted oxidoreductase
VISKNDPLPSPLGYPTRRSVLTAGLAGAGTLLVAGAAGVAGRGQVAHAAHAASTGSVADGPDVITRTIGRTGQRLPAIGLGPVVDPGERPWAQRARLRQILEAYWQAGGRVIDTSQLHGYSELVLGEVTSALGITSDVFLTSTSRQLPAARSRLRRDQMDVLHAHNLAGAEAVVPMLAQWKSAGKTRHIGISHHATQYYPAIEILIRNFDIDVIQIRYSILTRLAEERLLPLAAERGIGVIVAMPMEDGRLHKLVEGHQVPGWAADFGATTWAQFFLKYVLAHPAVTVVLQSTGSPAHLRENMAVLRGPLPDEDQRARMVAHMAGLAGFAQLEDAVLT